MISDKALVIVDVQKDFCQGGALAVPGADGIVPIIHRAASALRQQGGLVIATRDWHPPEHCSFADNGGVWPSHCVADTPGAMFHDGLDTDSIDLVVSKGTEADKEEYSGFARHELSVFLRENRVKTVYICGLATDYCVKETALGALGEGFDVVVLTDCVKGVDVTPGDSRKALEELKTRGAVLAGSKSMYH